MWIGAHAPRENLELHRPWIKLPPRPALRPNEISPRYSVPRGLAGVREWAEMLLDRMCSTNREPQPSATHTKSPPPTLEGHNRRDMRPGLGGELNHRWLMFLLFFARLFFKVFLLFYLSSIIFILFCSCSYLYNLVCRVLVFLS
jgi:hypothetical protein